MKLIYSLKFQFIALFLVFIVSVCLITALLGIQQLTTAVEETFKRQGVYIVERAASLIDGDAFEVLSKSLDINDPFYEEVRLNLRDLTLASGCLFLYTTAPYQGDIWHYIIDGSAEPDDEENFSALGEEDDTNLYDDAFRRTLNTQKTTTSHLTDQGEWGWLVSVYTPIYNSSGNIVGVIACDFDGTHLHETIMTGEIRSSIVGLISILLGIAMLLFFLRRIFTPLHKISTILKEISFGEGDLTKRIMIHTKNEIGELSDYFNTTLDKIKKLVVVIKGESNQLNNIGNDLASSMQQTAGAIFQITANIQSIKQKVTNQSASVTQTHSTMEQVSANILKLDNNVETQADSVSQSSSAIEEMLSNIQSVTQTLIRNAENVQELAKVSDIGRNSLQKVTHDIQEIAKESEGLLAINSVMENISSQTNLLSMNAAIEAAHAGEAGKGFAVVASEIRKLANNSSEQSKTISNVLKKIQSAIDAITSSTNTVIENFKDIDERVRTVSEQETIIRNAMEEQGQGSQQILEAISVLNEQTTIVKKGSMEMLDGSKEVIRESENLEKVTVEISHGMNEMAAGAGQIDTAVNHVNDISKETRERILNLFTEISKFKVS
ncbi:MAG: methyl-accepting chemotaxis protein [Treponema sp.]|jgi:methyl-accepting chemotaxis protein|nr:methyl-accepting chemotaxis protein [Treponema sp.]